MEPVEERKKVLSQKRGRRRMKKKDKEKGKTKLVLLN